jgi:hypothetical protein
MQRPIRAPRRWTVGRDPAVALAVGAALIALILLALVSLSRLHATSAGQNEAAEAAALPKSHTSPRYGYTVRYPSNWFPSANSYGNAFEIRDYPPRDPHAVPTVDQANLLMLDLPMASGPAANAYMDGIVAEPNTADRTVTTLTFEGLQAVRVEERLPAATLGPGAHQAIGPSAPAAPGTVLQIRTYIASGPFVLELWANVHDGARKEVTDEVRLIEGSVTFAA